MSTVFTAETILYGRWLGALHFVFQRDPDPATGDPPVTNRPVVPVDGSPLAIYADPIAYGLRQAGSPGGDPVTDADISRAARRQDMFLDLAEYRLGVTILASFTDVTESDFGRSASYNQYADRLEKRLDALMKQYSAFLGPYRAGAASGPIRWTPATARPPKWGPGYGGPAGRGGHGGWGC